MKHMIKELQLDLVLYSSMLKMNMYLISYDVALALKVLLKFMVYHSTVLLSSTAVGGCGAGSDSRSLCNRKFNRYRERFGTLYIVEP